MSERLPAGAGAPKLVEVADGVHAYLQPDGGWCLNNAGVIVGRDGAVVVDTAATVRRAQHLRAAVDSLAAAPGRAVVNTHFHGDHTFGNAVFGEAATIIAHADTRTDMAETGLGLTALWPSVEWGDVRVALPQVTYRGGGVTLHIDGRRVELLHFGPAHTRGDTVVWLPEERVLFTGDIVMPGCTPFVVMGSIEGSLVTLERLRGLGAATVVGGHGPVAGPESLDETEAYLRWIQGVAAEGFRQGLTPLETSIRCDLGDFAGLLDPERLVGNLHRAWAELEGGELARPLDPVAAFHEMVEYNGGRLPACYA
ncbi:MBL fold metallo-hydrolase [Streptomyces sp. GMR22]|uniref:MBL fold metallo-hydrolase n=1 Tax=Streptomyces sp. GMR22 TaxID=2759524 RepID=UPI0015FB6E58|nr:MBL fold metallo-hydrolase [Streptomyces sp. GMR22]MBA6437026.1 MBL fold metallo-hydrolase [Streptomyces sp. GMR22]